ncbi:pyrimidine dimer DNA glycosylase/endonuclease V [Candidatus Latescibacterota bacterium]
MRLWSIHPKYLDTKGFVALWRESLLAQKVLHKKTKGYRNHPQLDRFKRTENPVRAIAGYLEEIYQESLKRGYNFNRSKIIGQGTHRKITVTREQIRFELNHLIKKLKNRDINTLDKIKNIASPDPHPIFSVIEGDIEPWEIIHTKL